MKKRMTSVICIIAAVTCLGEGKKDTESFRKTVEFFASGPHYLATEHEDYVPQALKKQAGKYNLTREEAVAEMCSMAREYRRLSEDTSEKVTERMRQLGRMRLSAVLGFLGRLGDRSALPLFEEMTGAANGNTRLFAVEAYIKVAGVDSFPFIRSSFEKHPALLMEYTVIEEFGRQLKKAKNTSPNKDLSEAYIFLLREVREGKCRGDILDKVLCENLPEYATSIQREAAAETMMKSSNDYLRNMGNNIKNEIEKTPKEKRKDFKARGELLDPDRGK